jgi:type I restriction enzyme S subunit
LGDHVSKIGSGLTPLGGQSAYKTSGIPLIRSQNVLMNRFETQGLAYISKEQDDEMSGSRVQEGDVLLNITGASIGRVCVVPDEFCPANVNQHVCVIRPDASLDSDFLALYLATPQFQQFIGDTQAGATRQALTKALVEASVIPLPAKAEQQRMVSLLKEQFAEVARARSALEAQLEAAQSLPSVFMNAYVEDGCAAARDEVRLGEVLLGIDAGKCVACEEREAKTTEWGVLKVSAVTWSEFRPTENKVLPSGYAVPEQAEVRSGDLLISRSNTTELVGAVVLVRQTRPKLMLSDKTLRLVPRSDRVVSEFLEFALRSPRSRRFIEAKATGTSSSMKNITQESIRNIPVILPPLSEQRRIANQLAELHSCTTTLQIELKSRLKTIHRLASALLAKVFNNSGS